tara:strand:+ start:548 stop:1699 length:1152 start_codon:yes stop_codon:yes gene_type:complete
MRYFARISCIWLLLAMQVKADTSGSLEITGSYFPRSLGASFDTNITAEAKVIGYEELDDFQLEYEIIIRKSVNDNGKDIVEPRQLFVSKTFRDIDVYLGYRHTFWGVAESRNLVDLVNQQDLAAGVSPDNKLGAPSISIETYLGSGELQYWYIPRFRERTFNDANAHPGFGMPVSPAQFANVKGSKASDQALRYANSIGDIDFALSIFDGTVREPLILFQELEQPTIVPYYERMRSVGLELQYTGESILYKFEGLTGTQSEKDFDAVVFGTEKTVYSVFETPWDMGLIIEYQYDERPQAMLDRTLVSGIRLTANDEFDTNLLAIYTVGNDFSQSLFGLEVSRRLRTGMTLDLSYLLYHSDKQNLPFYSLVDDSELSFTIGYYF